MKQKVLIVVGPTSSGKSALAVHLAQKFNGEVISADSRQVYKGFDIGTGKITKREMKGVKHHLLDVVSPKRTFTASNFVQRARQVVDDISHCGKLPIVAGGTGFYIDALVGRIALPNVAVNTKLRASLEKKTASQLFTMLKRSDLRRASTIDRHNKRRLIRALEIVAAIGKVPKIDMRNRSSTYDALWIGMILQSNVMDKKIRARLKARIRQGMIEEAKLLRRSGLSYKRIRAFGLEYRALADLLEKKVQPAEFEEVLFRDIRRYAKRQLTYWGRNSAIRWFDVSKRSSIESAVRKWL